MKYWGSQHPRVEHGPLTNIIEMNERTERSHAEWSRRSSRRCTAHDMTFGGRCLNCGFPGAGQCAK